MQGLLQAANLRAATAGVAAAAARGATISAPAAAGFRPAPQQAPLVGKAFTHSVRTHATAVAEPVLPAEAVDNAQSTSTAPQDRTINDAQLQLKLIVPNSVAGAVLGRGGATVSAIKAATGCYVQLARVGTAVAGTRERLLIIAGDATDGVKQALSLVLEAIVGEGQEERLRSLRRYPKRVFLQQVVPAACAGKIMGPEGEQIKGISARTGCSVVVEARPKNAAFVPFRLVNYLGDTTAQLQAALSEVMDSLVEDEKYRPGIQEINSVCLRILPVPQRRVGNLLGPGGVHIKSLQEMLRVKVGVADAGEPDGDRHVTVWGAPQNVRVACDVIMCAAGTLPPEGAAAGAVGGAAGAAGDRRQQRGGSRAGGSDAGSVAGSATGSAAPSVAGSEAPGQ